jgi:hypothetical protein
MGISNKELAARRREKGLCPHCGKPAATGFITCQPCLEYQRKYRQDKKEGIRRYRAQVRPMKVEQIRAQHKRWRDRLKAEVVEAYGGRCACCSEDGPIFLCIDHINNDGSEHRKKLFGSRLVAGQRFYSWLRKNNFPEGYQVLCWNCNTAKHILGQCPHMQYEQQRAA